MTYEDELYPAILRIAIYSDGFVIEKLSCKFAKLIDINHHAQIRLC